MAAATSEMLAPDPQVLWAQLRQDWLILENQGEDWFEEVRDRRHQLESHPSSSTSPLVLIAEPDSATFLACFLAALLAGWNVAFANSQWGYQEWQSVSQLIAPDLVWGKCSAVFDAPAAEPSELFGICHSHSYWWE